MHSYTNLASIADGVWLIELGARELFRRLVLRESVLHSIALELLSVVKT